MAEDTLTRKRPLRPARPTPKKMKRKRPTDDDGATRMPTTAGHGQTPSQAPRQPKAKKQKKQKTAAKNGDDADADLDYDLALNRAFARMDSHLLADHLARQTKRFGRDLSAVELADLAVGAAAIRDTSSYARDRTLENLPDFLETFCAGEGGKTHLASSPLAMGAPHTIIVTGAGLRAANLVRAVRSFQTKNSAVSKLFAKHIKLAEAVEFLKTHRTGIAVGTPARLIDLLDHGALSVAHLQRLVVDASHIDQKKRGVLDMQDTALPVARWLARPEFKARYGGNVDETAGDPGNERDNPPSSSTSQPLSIFFY